MRGPQKFVVAATALSCLLIGTPAYAGDGSCPWRHLPLAVRTGAIEAGLAGGPAALSGRIPPEMLANAEKACGLKPDNAGAMHRAESGYMLQILAETWLQRNAALSAPELNRAWVMLGGDAKVPLLQWAVTLESDQEGFDQAYRRFLNLLGDRKTPLPSAKPQIVTYLQGRALRATFEPLFKQPARPR